VAPIRYESGCPLGAAHTLPQEGDAKLAECRLFGLNRPSCLVWQRIRFHLGNPYFKRRGSRPGLSKSIGIRLADGLRDLLE
jgi:hypothetical protein